MVFTKGHERCAEVVQVGPLDTVAIRPTQTLLMYPAWRCAALCMHIHRPYIEMVVAHCIQHGEHKLLTQIYMLTWFDPCKQPAT